MSVIEVKNLTKKFKVPIRKNIFKTLFEPEYEIKIAVNDISFKINKGESVAFLGQNGAGKTTTTKMMTGLIYPTSGEINVLGYIPNEKKKDYLKKIGLVMGNKSGLNWDLTARQTFNLYKKIYEISDKDFENRLDKLTKILDVKNYLDKPVRKLSLGERMKLELIGSIIHNPEILFLDEPTIGLDIIAKQNIRKFLREIQKESGITLVLTSHDMDDIDHVCDRVLVINHGSLVYDDSIKTLKSHYNQEKYVRFIFEETPTKEILNTINAEIFEKSERTVTFKIEPTKMPILISEVTSNINVADIDILSIPLEEMIKDIFENKV